METTLKKINKLDVPCKNGYFTQIQQLFCLGSINKRVNANSKTSNKGYEKTPMILSIAGYISYLFLFGVGWVRELLFGLGPVMNRGTKTFCEKNREGYAPLYASFESFYTRNVYRRLKNVFHQPITSCPGAKVTLLDRESPDDFWSFDMIEHKKKECINLGSYNYLGFAESDGKCTNEAIEQLKRSGLTYGSSRSEYGTSRIHKELEKTVAEFLGTEEAITVGMGFATNTLNLPLLLGKGCLAISDEYNHASIILGLRLSGATVAVFKHNNMESLEKVLRTNIIKGRPRTRRPWKKIFIVVEGVYSMEGSVVKLPEIIRIKNKYGAYLYLDEAHSVGAMGPRGRGIVDYYGLNPKDIDVMMGTFTKSFGAAGGYIAGPHELIGYLRKQSQAFMYPSSMSPPVAQQVISSMKSIMEPEGDGLKRVQRLARNSKYFRQRLEQMGFIVYGHNDSPVIPVLLFMVAKIGAFVVEGLKYNIATVGVGFPATKMTEERARFCMSSGHTKEMLDQVLEALDEMGDHLHIKYSRCKKHANKIIEY